MGLDDDASATLALPSRTDVVAYAEASFVTVEEVFTSLRDDELLERTGNFYDDEPWTVLDRLVHRSFEPTSRHDRSLEGCVRHPWNGNVLV
jgi:hypothetical protein